MKFQQLLAFEKHLEKAAPDHLSRVYLIAAPCSFERKKIIEMISAAIRIKEKKITTLSFDAIEGWAQANEELSTICFLNGHRIVVLEEAEKLKKGALEAVSTYVCKPSSHLYLIFSASSVKPFAELYERGKKELVVCDLSAEKPWERKERLKAQLVKMAAHEKKIFPREALDMLMERIGVEPAQLEQEMRKLLCYVAGRSQISVQDVHALCHSEKSASIWNLAEAIVWQERIMNVDASFELSSLLQLIAQIRLHLQQGLQCVCAKNEEIKCVASYFKPQWIEKITPIAQARHAIFFTEALAVIFNIEMLAKQSGLSPQLLTELLITKIQVLKKHAAFTA